MIFFFQAEDGIRDLTVTGVQTCALPISHRDWVSLAGTPYAPAPHHGYGRGWVDGQRLHGLPYRRQLRSEEHTSELQSQSNLVCRLLLEKKKKIRTTNTR